VAVVGAGLHRAVGGAGAAGARLLRGGARPGHGRLGRLGAQRRADLHRVLARPQAPLEAALGREAAEACFAVSEEAKTLITERISRHGIDCDLTPGQLICAARPSRMAGLARQHDDLARYGYTKTSC
jgi:gamma-glutamylputrescine oxidase